MQAHTRTKGMAFVIQIGSSPLPTPPWTVVATAIEKDQEDVCSSESTVEKSQQYITAAMDKEEQNEKNLVEYLFIYFFWTQAKVCHTGLFWTSDTDVLISLDPSQI